MKPLVELFLDYTDVLKYTDRARKMASILNMTVEYEIGMIAGFTLTSEPVCVYKVSLIYIKSDSQEADVLQD